MKAKLYWVKTHWFIRFIFREYLWKINPPGNKVYLTFDDGPTPLVTPWVLDQLNAAQCKATFFCIGNHVQDNPAIFKRIVDEGHAIGNHTLSHKNGWQTSCQSYLSDVMACEHLLQRQGIKSSLFRPPYGKLTWSQHRALKKMGHTIVMWDVLSGDFDQNLTPEQCAKNVIKNIAPGSIVIFHDSKKAFTNLQYALPAVLSLIKEKGYQAAAL